MMFEMACSAYDWLAFLAASLLTLPGAAVRTAPVQRHALATDVAQTTTSSASIPVLLTIDDNGNVVGRDLESGRMRMVAELSPEPRAYQPVASPSGRWLCARWHYHTTGMTYSMLVMFERKEDSWRAKWTTDVGIWRGVPVFAGDERYLIVGRVPTDHIGSPEPLEPQPESKARAQPRVLEVHSGALVENRIAPLHARLDTSVLGCSVDSRHVIVTIWKSDETSEICEYDIESWASRVLRSGRGPLKVDADRFAFYDENAVQIARFADPKAGIRLVERGELKAVMPHKAAVLVAAWEVDPAYRKDFLNLWCIDVDTLSRKRVIDHAAYMHNSQGWVSFLYVEAQSPDP